MTKLLYHLKNFWIDFNIKYNLEIKAFLHTLFVLVSGIIIILLLRIMPAIVLVILAIASLVVLYFIFLREQVKKE